MDVWPHSFYCPVLRQARSLGQGEPRGPLYGACRSPSTLPSARSCRDTSPPAQPCSIGEEPRDTAPDEYSAAGLCARTIYAALPSTDDITISRPGEVTRIATPGQPQSRWTRLSTPAEQPVTDHAAALGGPPETADPQNPKQPPRRVEGVQCQPTSNLKTGEDATVPCPSSLPGKQPCQPVSPKTGLNPQSKEEMGTTGGSNIHQVDTEIIMATGGENRPPGQSTGGGAGNPGLPECDAQGHSTPDGLHLPGGDIMSDDLDVASWHTVLRKGTAEGANADESSHARAVAHTLLGQPPATEELTTKRNYFFLMTQIHPDKVSAGQQERSERTSALLTGAYEFLQHVHKAPKKKAPAKEVKP